MVELNVAVIGARKTKTGIGPYIMRAIYHYYLKGRGKVKVFAATATSKENLSQIESNCKKLEIPVPNKLSVVNKRGGGLEQILDDEDINVVVICTPPGTHYEYALRAIDAGKHVLVEKPLVDFDDQINPALEVEELLVSACLKGVVMTVNTQTYDIMMYVRRFFGEAKIEPGVISIELYGKGEATHKALISGLAPHAASIVTALSPGVGSIGELATRAIDDRVRCSFSYCPSDSDQPYHVDISLVKGGKATERHLRIGNMYFVVRGENIQGKYMTGIYKVPLLPEPFGPIQDYIMRMYIEDITDTHIAGFLDTILKKGESNFFIPPDKVYEGFILSVCIGGYLPQCVDNIDKMNRSLDRAANYLLKQAKSFSSG